MKRFFKNKVARLSATASLDAFTKIPDSGFAFINNSQGASASIIELSNALDSVLKDIEFEGSSCIPSATRVIFDDKDRRSERLCHIGDEALG